MNRKSTPWDHLPDDRMLEELQRDSFGYFIREANPRNGLVHDRAAKESSASIAAVGLALSAYPVAIERSFISRREGLKRTLATLRFFRCSPQGPGPRATGYKGFYYHFLSLGTGQRARDCELSTIDTTILIAGMLSSAAYFNRESRDEREVRAIADELYRRVDWNWARAGRRTVTHGWKPGRGFLESRWRGYNEALLLYILGLGSPTHPLPAESYSEWASGFEWRTYSGIHFVYAGPLFIHQLPQVWLDLRGLRDKTMRRHRIDYFENSRRVTLVHQRYAMRNPGKFARYGEHCWGTTATDGPGNITRRIDGRKRRFFGYLARGVPSGPDDGTIAPWAAVASLPFAPDIVLPTIRYLDGLHLRRRGAYGFESSFNPTYLVAGNPNGWVAPSQYGLNQGPVVLMIENYRTGLIWKLMNRCPYIASGLRRAGFRAVR